MHILIHKKMILSGDFLPEMRDWRETIETDIIAPRLLCVTFKF